MKLSTKMKHYSMILAAALAVTACSSKGDQAVTETLYNGQTETQLVADNRVYFDFDSAEIKQESENVVITHAAYIQHKQQPVELAGHADERGTPEYNIALGQERAESVKQALTKLGVDTELVKTVSYGEEKPQVLGSTEEAYRKNRRVEFKY